MAWIESHQVLGQHPKTKKLARKLGVSMPTAVGHLQYLWWWSLDFAPDADLTRYDPEDIADAMLWQGKAELLIESLVESGFLERDGPSLLIHDWGEYAGRLIEKRKQNTERKRKSRGSHARQAQDTQGSHGATQHNTTQPYTTEHNQDIDDDWGPLMNEFFRLSNKSPTNPKSEDITEAMELAKSGIPIDFILRTMREIAEETEVSTMKYFRKSVVGRWEKVKKEKPKPPDPLAKEIAFQQFLMNGGNPDDFDWSIPH